MLGKTHLAIGVLLLFFLSKFTTIVTNDLIAAFLLLLGSILPDIDHSKSMIGRRVKIFSFLFKHRGFFHSIFGMVFITILVQLFFNSTNASIAFLIGYGSHLVADGVTKEGVNLFYPRQKKIKGPLVVGSFLETLIYLSLIVLGVYLII